MIIRGVFGVGWPEKPVGNLVTPSQTEQKRDAQYFSRMFKFSKIRSERKLKFSASRGSHISFLITSCFTLRTFAASSQCVLASRTQGLSSRKSSTVGLESRPDAMACCVWRPIPQCSSCPRAKSSPSAVRQVRTWICANGLWWPTQFRRAPSAFYHWWAEARRAAATNWLQRLKLPRKSNFTCDGGVIDKCCLRNRKWRIQMSM